MWRCFLWLLCCALLTKIQCLNDCLPSRDAYVNLELGAPEDVPVNFSSGAGSSICPQTSMTCCPRTVEQSMQNAALVNARSWLPEYSGYLNESDVKFFSHYGYVTDVVIEAIRRYFELSVPFNVTRIRGTLRRISRELNDMQNNNEGSDFRTRMRQLFSYTYLERMRGLYDLGPSNNYNNTFTRCALPIIEKTQISSEIFEAMDIMENQFRSLYQLREVLFSIHILFVQMERGLPFASCIRSFAELFYCHICLPETSGLFPCQNVCKNVVSGCTIFLHVAGEQLANPLQALCQINTMTTQPSWNLHTVLEVINNKLFSIFDVSEDILLQIASNISSCSDAPALASDPTPTDYHNRTTHGRVELLSVVPTSLTDYLYYTLVTNLSSIFINFENITQRILEAECGGFPANDGSQDFECWHRIQSSTDDVNFLGINFEAVLYGNGDLNPPDSSFVTDFNTSVAYMTANATAAMEYINSLPADMKINVDHCNLPLSQMSPLMSTVIPTTSGSIGTIPITGPTNSTITPGGSDDDSSAAKWIGLSTRLLLLPLILLLTLVY